MTIKFEQYLQEQNYAKLRRMMMGDMPHVNQVAILTAQNPQGQKSDAETNNKLNKQLFRDIKNGNFIPIRIKNSTPFPFSPARIEKIKGKFDGTEEDSFFVPHMDRRTVVALGQRYNQASVIWGEKKTDENGNPYFQFSYINASTGETENQRNVTVATSDVQKRHDYYSQIGGGKLKKGGGGKYKIQGGRKFIIPFFGDDYADYQPGEKYGTIVHSIPLDKQLKKAESFYIPLVDEVIKGIMPEIIGNVPNYSYYENKISKEDEITNKLIARIIECNKCIYDKSKTGKFLWMHRGIMNEKLNELEQRTRLLKERV